MTSWMPIFSPGRRGASPQGKLIAFLPLHQSIGGGYGWRSGTDGVQKYSVPTVVKVKRAAQVFRTGEMITLNGSTRNVKE
jgi:hypothetical protein